MINTTRSAYLQVAVCERQYALSIDEVVEVAAMVEAAPMLDEDNSALHGVVIRRGEPLILIDLRRLLDCEQAPIDLNTLFVVVRGDNELVGLIVDGVAGVVYLDDTSMQAKSKTSGYVRGVAAYEGALIQWFNLPAILTDTLPDNE